TFDMDDIGKRKLKNRCLLYLMQLPQYAQIGMLQFTSALQSNMTDTLAALIGLSHLDSPLRTEALNSFYQTWKNDALVMDKWLAIQAGSKLPNTLEQVKRLMHHEAFDIKNPNKVYSLIGSFGRNACQFNANNGEAYAFLSQVILQLDKINPHVSARMI